MQIKINVEFIGGIKLLWWAGEWSTSIGPIIHLLESHLKIVEVPISIHISSQQAHCIIEGLHMYIVHVAQGVTTEGN